MLRRQVRFPRSRLRRRPRHRRRALWFRKCLRRGRRFWRGRGGTLRGDKRRSADSELASPNVSRTLFDLYKYAFQRRNVTRGPATCRQPTSASDEVLADRNRANHKKKYEICAHTSVRSHSLANLTAPAQTSHRRMPATTPKAETPRKSTELTLHRISRLTSCVFESNGKVYVKI